jgi:hypothetical protein
MATLCVECLTYEAIATIWHCLQKTGNTVINNKNGASVNSPIALHKSTR